MSTRKQTEIDLVESGQMAGMLGGFAGIGNQIMGMGTTFNTNPYSTQ